MKVFIRLAFVVLLLQVPVRAYSQDSLLIRLAEENHTTFAYDGDTFSGTGWEMITNKIGTAGNVLIGEDHFTSEIPAFAEAITKNGSFDNVIIEMDPYSTEIIESSIKNLSEEERKAFNEKYQSHFSFYALAPEYKFLREAVNDRINLLGAEQIFKFADRLILQKLQRVTEIEQAKHIYRDMMSRAKTHFDNFLQEPEQTAYFMTPHFKRQLHALDELNLSGSERAILEDMKISQSIYQNDDHKKRIQLMKYILLNRIEQWYTEKNLFKYGAIHMPSGESLLSIYDVGNLVLNVTDAQFKDSYHIVAVAKSRTKGAPFPGFSNSEINSSKGMLGSLAPFFSVVDGDNWYSFDMQPVRRAINNGELKISDVILERVIKGYDTLVIIPEATAAGF